ncbi:MAG: hypothetical protein IPK16_18790 [Anaerolineales bacterium]|nr:hypothetical protein [Anaerolineales bacterium]
MKKHRPIGVTILAVLSLIAAAVAIYYALIYFGLFPMSLGPLDFYNNNFLGGLMWVLMAVIYFVVFRWLWTVDPRGWMFVTIIAVLNLIMAVLSWIGKQSFAAVAPAILINGIILLYAIYPGTKAAFGMQNPPAAKQAAAAPPPASKQDPPPPAAKK